MFERKATACEEKLKGVTQLLYILTQQQGGNIRFTDEELESVPLNASLKFHNIPNGLELVTSVIPTARAAD